MVGKDTKIEDSFLEVDYENGLIIRRPKGSRVLVLGSLGWAMLEHELVSTFVTGAAVILQRMGYSYGRYLGRVAKARNEQAVRRRIGSLRTILQALLARAFRLVKLPGLITVTRHNPRNQAGGGALPVAQ